MGPSTPPFHVVQVNTLDSLGGASQVAGNLCRSYIRRGLKAWMAVGRKLSQAPTVLEIPNDEAKSLYTRSVLEWAERLDALRKGTGEINILSKILGFIAEPRRWLDIFKGIEDFSYPGSWQLFELVPELPDILHCHNLHGNYFDLRALPCLSHQLPVVLTLHDAWLLSGHCAHSFDCERWLTGCGQCPDLSIPPSVERDATAFNWRRKRDIYAKSRLYVATPSKWLMNKVERSILATAVIEGRVIPNGVDLTIFRPLDRQKLRSVMDIPPDAKVLLCSASGIRRSRWKDYRTMEAAIALVAERLNGHEVLFIALGEDAPAEHIGQARIRFVQYQKDPEVLASYYGAADIYIHAAKADTFPNTILEALACGKPVVATAVGGITEQVKSMKQVGLSLDCAAYSLEEATGCLVPPGDAEAMGAAILELLTNGGLRERLGENAAEDARSRFDLERQAEDYLEWYRTISHERSILATANPPLTTTAIRF